MIKAINQWGFAEGTSLDYIFEQSSAAGFDAVELNLNPPGSIGLTPETTPGEAEAIGRLAQRYGLKLRSLSTGMLWSAPLSSPDESVRLEARRIVTKQLELAGLLGMDTVLVVPGIVDADTAYDSCYSRTQEEMMRLIPVAERERVAIGIENVWNKFLMSPLEMARYVDDLGSPYVGVYFDAGNVLQFGYPEQWIRILHTRIRKVHVKDFRLSVGNISGFVPLFAGDVNWCEVGKALRDIGYDDVLTAELAPYSHDPIQMIKDTARHMDLIIQS